MNYKETKVAETRFFDGKIFNVRRDDILLPNGKPATREVIEHSGGSAVLIVDNGKIMLVKQHRYPFDEELLEVPAGKRNNGEEPIETAIRELEEEAGLKAESVELIYKMYPSPAYDSEIIYIYEAKNFTKTKQKLDEDEFLTAEWYDLDEVEQMLKDGKIKDGKSLIAILYALNNR